MELENGLAITVIDNFIDHKDWKNIHDTMVSSSFSWYYNKSHDSEEDWNYSHLTHVFYSGVVKENQNTYK